MRTSFACLVGAALLTVASARPARAQTEFVSVQDFAGIQTYGLTATGKIRRGITSSVQVVKNLVDLVPDALINVTGGTIVGTITHSRSSAGVGLILLKVSVSSGASVGSTVTLNVGTSDHFKFTVVHESQISTVSFPTNPTTIVGGTPFDAVVTGVDFGTPTLSQSCHSGVLKSIAPTTFTMTLTRLSTCSTNNGPFAMEFSSTNSLDPNGVWKKSDGTFSFSFGPYQAPPPVGVACVSIPNLRAPAITAPAANSTIAFFPSSNAIQPITISWDRKINNVDAPNNEWVVTLPTVIGVSRGTTQNVTGTSISPKFSVPGTYTVSVRAFNCGTTAGTANVTFTLKFESP